MRSLAAIDLELSVPFNGTFAGRGQYQLFRVQLADARPLRIDLDDAAAANRHELYVRMGSPPTRSSFQFQSTAVAADQRIIVPMAAPGDWYVLVYTESAAALSNFSLLATAKPLFIDRVTPNRVSDGAEAVLTVSGAGFTGGTKVQLVGRTTLRSRALSKFTRPSGSPFASQRTRCRRTCIRCESLCPMTRRLNSRAR